MNVSDNWKRLVNVSDRQIYSSLIYVSIIQFLQYQIQTLSFLSKYSMTMSGLPWILQFYILYILFSYLLYLIYIHNSPFLYSKIHTQEQKMTTNQSKVRDIRKAKTSILFQIKQNTEQNIEVGQSMNIISLNNPLKYRMNGPDNIPNKNQNSFSKNHIRRVNQSSKLTIKLALQHPSGNSLANEDENNRAISFHSMGTAKKSGINQIIEKFQKRNLIVLQKHRVLSDIGSFTTICIQFLQKIDGLYLQNNDLTSKIKKYESYFKQLKTKQLPSQSTNPFIESPNQKQDRTSQLKILNLERKVETLTYIIKNYRSNNKEELKEFEKKIHEYKPTIQNQLADMLAQANKKYQDIHKVVEFYQHEYGKHCKEGTWVQLVGSLREKDLTISRLESRVKQIDLLNMELNNEVQIGKSWREQLDQLNKELMQANFENGELAKKLSKSNEERINRQNEYSELVQQKQELSYKYEALLPLESKIKEKQQVIKKNTIAIARIQSENTLLKNKIGSLVKNFQTEYFNKESASIQTIQKCSTTIEELASRFLEEIDGMPEVSKELTSFITHLFDKTKNSFQKMIQEYRLQIQTVCMQNKQLKNHLNCMINLNQRKYERSQELIKEMQNIELKRKRCEQSQCKIELKQNCQSCLNWVLHWGQLNNLYIQMQALVHKLRDVQ